MVGLSIALEEHHHHNQQQQQAESHHHRRHRNTTAEVISKTKMSMVINNPSTGTGTGSSSSSSSSSFYSNPSSPYSSSSSAFRPAFHFADFLDHCFLCRTKLSPGKDIYMYRGDRAFCSEECRCRQILLDEEEAFRRENQNQSHCSSSAHPSPSRNERGTRNRASGGL